MPISEGLVTEQMEGRIRHILADRTTDGRWTLDLKVNTHPYITHYLGDKGQSLVDCIAGAYRLAIVPHGSSFVNPIQPDEEGYNAS